jgi:DNA-binding transcriptional ArsR family regulator
MTVEMSDTLPQQPAAEELELPAVLHALSDPIRLRIVRDLADAGACNCGSFAVPVAKSTLSHHLRVLREAGVTLTEPNGTQRVVSLRRADLDARFPGLLDAVLALTTAAPKAGLRRRVPVPAHLAERAAVDALAQRGAEAHRSPVLAAERLADGVLVQLAAIAEQVLDERDLAVRPELELLLVVLGGRDVRRPGGHAVMAGARRRAHD